MAQRQKLKLTLKNISNGREWVHQAIEITADPDDHSTVAPSIIQLARDLDGRTGDPWWADQYKGHIQGIDEPWRDYWIFGGGY